MTNATLHADAVISRSEPRRRRMPAITTEGLVRSFGGVAAVDGLDLDIPQGEIYGFLGPNGAGKLERPGFGGDSSAWEWSLTCG
jgi:ATPase subunit of ABC transporter with duplicated ATPase domains